MIDDATILRFGAEFVELAERYARNEIHKYQLAEEAQNRARAIEQLARQEQREADARICEEHWEIDGTITAKEFASAIRASGKENSNEQSE